MPDLQGLQTKELPWPRAGKFIPSASGAQIYTWVGDATAKGLRLQEASSIASIQPELRKMHL